jgi:DNA repair protein RecO (recombination protein O)
MPRTFASATYHARAIVLRVRNLGEKDRVMTMLSEERGKLDATARGARRPKGKLTAVAQPFILARFLIAHGRSLDIATQAEIENAHPHIPADLLKTAWATYCCELSSFLPEALPENELFELLRDTLEALDEFPSRRAEEIGRWFEARYLTLLGYAPQIGRCVSCEKKIVVPAEDSNRRLIYSPALGGTLCGDCAARDAQRLTVNVQALRALHHLSRSAQPFELELTGAARRDLRDCLRRGLAAHLEMKPRSQAFLDEVTHDLAVIAPESGGDSASPSLSNDV